MDHFVFSYALKTKRHWNLIARCYERKRVISNYSSIECTENQFVMDSFTANKQKDEII